MLSLTDLVHHGATSAWLLIPSAVLLGALHGLEPGHSKTMMAAFIIAVRGTVGQAILLGLSATFSHTLIVWVVALAGMRLGGSWNVASTEPFFQIASAVLIVAVAAWMMWRTWREQRGMAIENDRAGTHHHETPHHPEEPRRIDTGHGLLSLEIFKDGVPSRWRIRSESGRLWPARGVKVETLRSGGERETFTFSDRGTYLESFAEIPEPHAFTARVRLAHGSHTHDYDVAFDDHSSALPPPAGPSEGADLDAHGRAHANDIRRRFSSGAATTGQIVMFGLTGGLVPCPAAITVLVLCLQLKQFGLGVLLVLAFSVGLAVTMVTAGVLASLGLRQAVGRWPGLETFAQRARYASGLLITCLGLFVGWQGLAGLVSAGAL